MSISSWICTNSSKPLFLRIVHPGGHSELHDRPVLAAEIMRRNPRCCVTYPHVFQRPWAVVAPDTMLMPGQKFYVVPLSTIRKLQRLSPKRYPSPLHESRSVQFSNEEEDDGGMISTCCIFGNKISKQLHDSNKHARNEGERSQIRESNCFHIHSCFPGLFTRVTIKQKPDGLLKETGFCDNYTRTKKRTQDLTGNSTGASPRRLSSSLWQPRLESIIEE
ncbi:hypothetical protein QN277_022609 [Acacia crassicarpa]|uniref:Uncharacterized protein n=1 Tax=Acacia crassicarpa TaxID=499986 RepID=A0AAE1MM36_9FABA|nr:hypothetical protein QN277_022609 [Acacia crassicarpa]